MVNAENILKVADAIEQHSIPDLGFNMGVVHGNANPGLRDLSGHNCGTVACIAGWTHQVFKTGGHTISPAGYVLGLNEQESEALFLPEGWADDEIGPQQAVRTLRHLAATGEVDWTV